jgi:hypothetical protein
MRMPEKTAPFVRNLPFGQRIHKRNGKSKLVIAVSNAANRKAGTYQANLKQDTATDFH